MIKYVLFLLIAINVIIFLFRVKPTQPNRSRILVLCFVFQLVIPQILKQQVSGIEAGGSALYNLLLAFSWLLSISVLLNLILIGRTLRLNHFPPTKRINSFLLSGWVILFLLEGVYDYLSPTKIIPICSTFTFLILFIMSIYYPIDSESIYSEVTNIGAIIGTTLILTFLLKFPYFGSSELDYSGADANYFSILNQLFGLPPRLAGPFSLFGGVQIMGLFFSFAQACNGLRRSRKYYLANSSIFFVAGSATGSRTFYLTFILVLFLTNSFGKQYRKRFRILNQSLFFVTIAISAYFLIKIVLKSTVTAGQQVSQINGRALIWKAIASHWNSNGLFGQGPRTFSKLIDPLVGFPAAHAHNSFLEYLWSYGIVGAIGIGLVYSGTVLQAISNFKNDRGPFIIILVILSVFTERNLRVNMQDIVGLFWICIMNLISQKNETGRNIKV